ncbi:oligosaccharide flippase family protein [Oceaniradius stylonematis]|uniref:oligosaccharide flippase family protein n=1 Tax=Oceaniradius stylonematis TaxID=2184161 RepID=UPI00273F9B6F|nr:oligosaccharide flippase family protein [Oceaniradius stylonematis]
MKLSRLRSELTGSKLSRDILWTFGSFGVLAASGIVINVALVFLRDASALGIFNQAYSVYIVLSQLAVFGFHHSVLRNAAYHRDDRDELARILWSALVPAVAIGSIWAILVWNLEPSIARLLGSDSAARATAYAGLGLALFPASKVLLAFLNGLRCMEAFSVLQALRYIVITAVAIGVAAGPGAFETAALGFVLAEAATSAGALFYIFYRRLCPMGLPRSDWIARHVRFGSKSLVAGMFAEANTRVDVIMLGILMSDTAVGIYSFAAMLIDGAAHIITVIRTNFNPVLVRVIKENDWSGAANLLSKSKGLMTALFAGLTVVILAGFWMFTTQLFPELGLAGGLPALAILFVGLTIVSGLMPFDNLLLVGGFPGLQTLQQLAAVLANVAGNWLMIPLFGISGAALGTVCGYMAGIALLVLMARRRFGWNLLTNRTR